MSSNINLLAWREGRRAKRTRRFYMVMLLVGAVGAGLGGVVAHGYQHALANQQLRNAHIGEQIADFEHEVAESERFRRERDQLDRQIGHFRRLLETRPLTLRLFNDLAESHVAGVTYRRLERRHGRISASAVTDSERQITEQLHRLAERPGLETPVLAEMSRDSSGLRLFTFEIAQVRSAGGGASP